jgi:hypothetical protein
MAATVIPGQLDFFKGLTDAQQILGVTVTGENVIISVPAAPAGDFSWDPSPAAGWELRKRQLSGGAVPPEALTPPSLVIRVRFKPSSPNEVHGTLTVNATQNDAARTPIPNFPVSVPLRGNVGGVGPGMLKITEVNANPVGPDLGPGPDQEFVEIINISGSQLDLNGCRVGDLVIGVEHGGERDLLRFTNTYTLAPMGGAGTPKKLRIFTGAGVPANPSFDQIALNRGSPVWNNAGDIAWIKNPSNQYVDRLSTFPTVSGGGGSPPPTTSMTTPRTTSTTVTPVPIPPTTSFLATGITVEEADLLSFAAFGQVWTSPGLERSTGPDGTSTDPAPLGWGPADAPPYSLIGRIGSGNPFYVGPVNSKVVRNDGGMLFLGINDPIPEGNWGSGFTCIVTLTRTS